MVKGSGHRKLGYRTDHRNGRDGPDAIACFRRKRFTATSCNRLHFQHNLISYSRVELDAERSDGKIRRGVNDSCQRHDYVEIRHARRRRAGSRNCRNAAGASTSATRHPIIHHLRRR